MAPINLQNVQQLISEGKTDNAISMLQEIVKEKSPQWMESVVLLRSNLAQLNEEVLKGVIDSEKAQIRRNNVNSGVMKLIGFMQNDTQRPDDVVTELKESLLQSRIDRQNTNTSKIEDSIIHVENSSNAIVGSGNVVTNKFFQGQGRKQFMWILGSILVGIIIFSIVGNILSSQQKDTYFSLQEIDKEINTLSKLTVAFQEKIEKNRVNLELWLSEGNKAMKEKDYVTAIQFYERVAEKVALATVHQNLSVAYEQIGDSHKASQNRSKAKIINPNIKLSRSNTSLEGKRINLISSQNGGEILILPLPEFEKLNDDLEEISKSVWYSNISPITYGFKDGRSAYFDMFTILITKTSHENISDFEIYYGNDSPESDNFELIGRFTTTNAMVTRTPYQEFAFEKVRAKYFRFIPKQKNTNWIKFHEIQLWGTLD